jgi:NAD(P)-dependent dehydrogenase (short-subunit alcohol dehydrogenase family)
MRVLVTGARGGIGRAVVAEFDAAGYEVVALDLRPASDDDRDVVHLIGDLLDPGAYAELDRQLGDAPLDAVVSAQGIGLGRTIDTTTESDSRYTMELNFLTVTRLFALVRERLRHSGGSFTTIASQAGLVGEPNLTAYSAAKAAVLGWTRGMASRPEAEGIRLRAICPGCVDTGALAVALGEVAQADGVDVATVLGRRVSGIPLGRLSSTREQAAGILWLSRARTPAPLVMADNGGEVLR